MKIGFHASHEQFKPSALLQYVQSAQEAGFDAAMSSDHFHPWSRDQGESGFAWSWLGAAMQATSLPFGVVCAPGDRYHPAIIAQGAATLAEMFPGRFWIALGSGQLLNEGVTGSHWPTKKERNERLRESAEIIRALWRGEKVTRSGVVRVEEAKLYTRPAEPPLLLGAALTPETAEWIGGWADGLITISHPREELAEVVEAFRRGGGEGKPMYLKVQLSYAQNDDEALQGAYEQWRTTIFDSQVQSALRTPENFEAAAEFTRLDDLKDAVRISSDTGEHLQWLRDDLAMGFECLILHNVNREQKRFVDDFGDKVLPALRS
jgi:coenzyme F420-dependent glucose-6-phosphate dehydrogenase